MSAPDPADQTRRIPRDHVLAVSRRVAVRLLAVGYGVTIAIVLVDGEPVRVVESGEG